VKNLLPKEQAYHHHFAIQCQGKEWSILEGIPFLNQELEKG